MRGRGLPNRTLLWGGALLLGSALLSVLALVLEPSITWRTGFDYLPDALPSVPFFAACLVLALGLGGGGSIVGNSVWGRVSVIGTGAASLYGSGYSVLSDHSHSSPGFAAAVVTALLAPAFMAAAVFAIAWTRAMPGLWRFVPAAGLVVVVATWQLGPWPAQGIIHVVVVATFGIAALFLAGRCRRLARRR